MPAFLWLSSSSGRSTWRFWTRSQATACSWGGGPLGEGEERFLLIVAAENQHAIEARLANDPWTRLGVWRIASIERWEVLLGARL